MSTSRKGSLCQTTITTSSPLELGREYKSVEAMDGLVYLRCSAIMAAVDSKNEGHTYRIQYQSAKAMANVATVSAYLCQCCSKDCVEFFVLTEATRRAANLLKLHATHMKCVEASIGRRLRMKDFTKCPANEHVRLLFQMGRRSALKKIKRDKR